MQLQSPASALHHHDNGAPDWQQALPAEWHAETIAPQRFTRHGHQDAGKYEEPVERRGADDARPHREHYQEKHHGKDGVAVAEKEIAHLDIPGAQAGGGFLDTARGLVRFGCRACHLIAIRPQKLYHLKNVSHCVNPLLRSRLMFSSSRYGTRMFSSASRFWAISVRV